MAQNACPHALYCKAAQPQIQGNLLDCRYLSSPTRGREVETHSPAPPIYFTGGSLGRKSVQIPEKHGNSTLQ